MLISIYNMYMYIYIYVYIYMHIFFALGYVVSHFQVFSQIQCVCLVI